MNDEMLPKNTLLFPFDFIETSIEVLLIDIRVLNKNFRDFPKAMVDQIKGIGEVGDHLVLYLILEIQDFYRQAYRRFGDKAGFPESADSVKELRDSIVGHLNCDSLQELLELCERIGSKYSSNKIYMDWREFKEQLYSKIKGGILNSKRI